MYPTAFGSDGGAFGQHRTALRACRHAATGIAFTTTTTRHTYERAGTISKCILSGHIDFFRLARPTRSHCSSVQSLCSLVLIIHVWKLLYTRPFTPLHPCSKNAVFKQCKLALPGHIFSTSNRERNARYFYFPCRCLCFGFSLQMMYTRPFLRTGLQPWHNRLTDERVFMPRTCCVAAVLTDEELLFLEKKRTALDFWVVAGMLLGRRRAELKRRRSGIVGWRKRKRERGERYACRRECGCGIVRLVVVRCRSRVLSSKGPRRSKLRRPLR